MKTFIHIFRVYEINPNGILHGGFKAKYTDKHTDKSMRMTAVIEIHTKKSQQQQVD